MAFDFPAAPVIGETWPNPPVVGQPVYTWDGQKWGNKTPVGSPESRYAVVYIGDTAPPAASGALWWESDTGYLYTYYYDGNSGQWVMVLAGLANNVFKLLNLPVSAAPPTPSDGDVWRQDNTNTGLKIRVNGVTKTFTLT
jgi:hypothetical protein